MNGWPKLLPQGRTNGLMQKSKCPDRPNISEPNKTTPSQDQKKKISSEDEYFTTFINKARGFLMHSGGRERD